MTLYASELVTKLPAMFCTFHAHILKSFSVIGKPFFKETKNKIYMYTVLAENMCREVFMSNK